MKREEPKAKAEIDRNQLMGYEEESTPSWGDPEITPDYEPEAPRIKLLTHEAYKKATADLKKEDLPF